MMIIPTTSSLARGPRKAASVLAGRGDYIRPWTAVLLGEMRQDMERRESLSPNQGGDASHKDASPFAFGAGQESERCSFCGDPAEGNYSIHRDGFGVGPEVPLCDDCGAHPRPTCGEIWDRIS